MFKQELVLKYQELVSKIPKISTKIYKNEFIIFYECRQERRQDIVPKIQDLDKKDQFIIFLTVHT